MELNAEIALKVLKAVDAGLVQGLGQAAAAAAAARATRR